MIEEEVNRWVMDFQTEKIVLIRKLKKNTKFTRFTSVFERSRLQSRGTSQFYVAPYAVRLNTAFCVQS